MRLLRVSNGIMDADRRTVRSVLARRRSLIKKLFPEEPDHVVGRVFRRTENRLAARLAKGHGTTTLERDALALIKRSLGHEERRRSAKRRQTHAPESSHEQTHGARCLTYLETLTCLWLRAGFTIPEIADEQHTSVMAIRRLLDRAVRKLLMAQHAVHAKTRTQSK